MKTAEQSSAIVNSLFPANVRERLFMSGMESSSTHRTSKAKTHAIDDSSAEKRHFHFPSHHPRSKSGLPEPAKLRLKSWMADDDTSFGTDDFRLVSPPIADLFPHCTVMFADIAGFTAWSSEREPSQVFVLLETLYRYVSNGLDPTWVRSCHSSSLFLFPQKLRRGHQSPWYLQSGDDRGLLCSSDRPSRAS